MMILIFVWMNFFDTISPLNIIESAMTGTVYPNSSEVRSAILQLQRRHPGLVQVRTIMRSGEGRPIDAVTLTDRSVPKAGKQHVLIVAGQHGNEETGRLVALRLMDYLVSPAGRKHLRCQHIVVMPNVSPDAAERDTYCTPAGIKPNLDHALTGATSPEGQAVETVVRALQPELFVDIHARGHAGCSYDMVLYPASREYTEDDNLLHAIAAEMVAAGESAGIPHVTHPLTWSGWGDADPNQPSSTCMAYRTCKSIVLLTENAEHNEVVYPAALRVRTGLARLKTLLAWGQRRHPSLYYAGYPCYLLAGTFTIGLVAVGSTAAARRRSRIELWRHAAGMKCIRPELPEQARRKNLHIEYEGKPLTCGAGFQVRAAGRLRVKAVRFNGRELPPAEVGGYYTWRDTCSTFVVASARRLEPGRHELSVDFY
jgi:hypothetical protein